VDNLSPQSTGCAFVNIAQDSVVQGEHTVSLCSAHCPTRPHSPELCPRTSPQGSVGLILWPIWVPLGGSPACKCINWSLSVCFHLHSWQ